MNFTVFKELVSHIEELSFGDKVEILNDLLPTISEITYDKQIFIETRQRFASNGLIDNLIIHLSKKSSIGLGLWILAAYFQRNYEIYLLRLENCESKVKEIRIHFNQSKNPFVSRQPKVNLEKFDWTATNVEDFVAEAKFYFGHKIEIILTNETGDFYTIEQFNARDILTGFGEIGGGILMAEFFLNLGLMPSQVNYEYIKYELANRILANEKSCEFRAEIIHPQQIEEVISSIN